MIDGAIQQRVTEDVVRLAAFHTEPLESVLLRRNIEPDSLEDAKEAMAGVSVPLNPDELLDYPFRPRDDDPPYGIGRFGDGTHPVFYSAREEETCIEEMKFHNRISLEELRSGALPYPRYFYLLRCAFDGSVMILLGHEGHHKELISPTDAGYPFCRRVARWSMGEGAHALHTASARRAGGRCVPVFARETLSSPRIGDRFRFAAFDGQVIHERV